MAKILDKFKKPKPAELYTKLSLAETKLTKREDLLKERKNKARDAAKDALKKGSEREFKVESRKYGGLQAQLTTVGGMVEMARTMSDVIAQQKDLTEIVAIGEDLVKAQKALGFDTEKIEHAITGIREAVDKVTTASEMIVTQTEALTTATPEATKEQESLKSELLKEIEIEKAKGEELEEKIKKEKEKV